MSPSACDGAFLEFCSEHICHLGKASEQGHTSKKRVHHVKSSFFCTLCKTLPPNHMPQRAQYSGTIISLQLNKNIFFTSSSCERKKERVEKSGSQLGLIALSIPFLKKTMASCCFASENEEKIVNSALPLRSVFYLLVFTRHCFFYVIMLVPVASHLTLLLKKIVNPLTSTIYDDEANHLLF